MKRRLLALILTLLAILSLAACNEPAEDPSGDTKGTETTAEAPTTGETDETTGGDAVEETTRDGEDETTAGDQLFDGPLPTYNDDEFSILFRPDDRFINAILVEQLGTAPTSVERAVYERMMNIEDTFRIKFAIERADDYRDDMSTRLGNYAKAEADSLDLANAHARFVPWALAINGSLYEWSDLELIDTEASYWSQNAKEQLSTPGGKIYFLTGDANYLTVGTAFCMFFNKDMVMDVEGLELPYEAVRRDEWTFEVFENYVTTVDGNLNGDNSGELGKDMFGYVTPFNRGPLCAINCAGIPLLTRDDGEKLGYRYTVNKEVVTRAVNDYVDLMLNSGSALYYKFDTDAQKTMLHTAFISETVCFFDDEVDFAGTFAKSGINFGVLPWPKYDEDVEGYTSLVDAGVDVFAVLINTSEENAERISYVLESLAYYGQRDVMPLYYDTILTYQYMKDVESIEMLGYIHDSLVFDFSFFYNPGGLAEAAMSILSGGGSSSLPTFVSQKKPTINDDLKKWVELDD